MSHGRVQPTRLPLFERKEYRDILWTSVATLRGREEVKNFFKDLLSESETIMLGRRLMIAKELLEGKTYQEIEEAYHVGKATIGAVQHWLTSGFGGFEPTIERFAREWDKRAKRKEERIKARDPFSMAGLKRRYPMHFLLLNLFDELAAGRAHRRRKKSAGKSGRKSSKWFKKR